MNSSSHAVPGDITDVVAKATKKVDPLVQAISRVAHEVCTAYAVSCGNYATPAWEKLSDTEQSRTHAKVQMFLNTPGMPATSGMAPVATLTAQERSTAYIFQGVVAAIAREQNRV